MKKPILLFNWQKPFLKSLKTRIEKDTADAPGGACIIAPNNRIWRYLQDLYGRDSKCQLMPRIISYAELVEIWSAPYNVGVELTANSLDLVSLAYEAVQLSASEHAYLAKHFARMDIKSFLPWGFRLVQLFDEIFNEGLLPKDIVYARNDVVPRAAALLESLGTTGKYWVELLIRRKWTTFGYNAFKAFVHSDMIPDSLLPGPHKKIYIAGFYALNGVQNSIFHSLWLKGASICFHTHPEIQNSVIHGPGLKHHRKWISRWKAEVEMVESPELRIDMRPEIKFFQGYDLHSQLFGMEKNLIETDKENTAIIISDSGALIPVLHHVHNESVNISLGYPLQRSLIYILITILFSLQKNKSSLGDYYNKDLLAFFSSPFLKVLFTGKDEAGLKIALSLLEKDLYSGSKYVNLHQLIDKILPFISEEEKYLLSKCVTIFVDAFDKVKSLGEMGVALNNLLQFLVLNIGNLWKDNPLEAEAISRIKTDIVPVLLENSLNHVELEITTLELIFSQLIQTEFIPFEADPIQGVQIMGWTESQLLQFDKILVIDANDDILPGKKSPDPLLPEALRSLLGLPNSQKVEESMEYNFFRLYSGAKKVYLSWQESSTKSDLLDSKKIRSRYIEFLIWQEEKKRRKFFETQNEIFSKAEANIALTPCHNSFLPRNRFLENKLEKLLSKQLSATFLDNYYSCPLSFARSRLLNINPVDKMRDGDDPRLVGTLIHNTLKAFFLNHTGRQLVIKDNLEESYNLLLAEFEKQKKIYDIEKILPLDSCLVLDQAVNHRFKKFLSNFPETIIEKVEWELTEDIIFFGKTIKCKAVVDRLDLRDDHYLILDYKTSALKTFDRDLFSDNDFFMKLSQLSSDTVRQSEKMEEYFLLLRDRLPSIQLPFYLVMLDHQKKYKLGGASYIDLYDTCKEKSIFPKSSSGEFVKILEYCWIAVKFLINNLLFSQGFNGNGKFCSSCPTRSLCLC